MRATDFFDTNVLLYLFSGDDVKADRAEALLAAGGVVSVQVLNEFASVASRKLAMPWAEIQTVLRDIRRLCKVAPLTVEAHERGLELVQRYGFSLYDAMVVASALEVGCATLWSEDFQDGLRVDGALTIRNPFKG
ncbi:MAG: pilus assembly protein [Methylophilales bacterium RIFCSPHIGHO2_02_FULL_57_10]|nr:MAG: pilus assembly protein [Methylophilales bacterium RIFCSPHIGHO2_02_FULL_57_10]